MKKKIQTEALPLRNSPFQTSSWELISAAQIYGGAQMRAILALAVLMTFSAICTAEPPRINARTISAAESVLAMYVAEGWVSDPQGPQLIIAVWPDGRAVWSENRILGGPPYRTAQIVPEKVKAVLLEIAEDGYFEDESLG